jgi:hypothetical protein
VPLVAGRNFFSQFPDIKKPEFIVNEAAVKALQLKDPVGKRFVLDTDTGEVVGVMKDFNFASLHSAIEPMVIQYNPYRANYLLLKVRPDQFRQTLARRQHFRRNPVVIPGFFKPCPACNVIAWPLGWWAMSYWLHGFAYHISIGAGAFAISGVAAFLVGLLTVSSQAVKAAIGNPVDSLRSE